MKTLIIPDIHNRTSAADAVIAAVSDADEIVFLGDFFDNWFDHAEDAERTARWLKGQLALPRRVFLLGNHDVYYFARRAARIRGGGFSHGKAEAIWRILGWEDWSRFALFHATQGWVLSHGGFHPNRLHPARGFDVEDQRAEEKKALLWLSASEVHPLVAIGMSRGGLQEHGGVTWLDWNELEPIEGLHQIVGHTPAREVREKHGPNSRNYCLDTNSKHYGILQDGQLTVHSTPRITKAS